MQRTFWLFLSAFILAFSVSAQAAVLVNPDPVAVPAELNNKQIVTEIKRALVGRGWVVASEEPGTINATLNLRSHVARVAISYDAKQVHLAYVSSDNLKYKEKNGKRTIHKNYLSWVNNLMGDIYRNLQTAAL